MIDNRDKSSIRLMFNLSLITCTLSMTLFLVAAIKVNLQWVITFYLFAIYGFLTLIVVALIRKPIRPASKITTKIQDFQEEPRDSEYDNITEAP